jgi:hypothetical protein
VRRALTGAAVGLAVYFVLLVIASAAVGSADSVHARNVGWVLASAVAGLLAGFAGDRATLAAERSTRYAAGIAGPALVSLVFAVTSTAASQSARWGALAVTVVAAALGAGLRETLGGTQRRH